MSIAAHCGKVLGSFKSIRLIRLDQVSNFPIVIGTDTYGNLTITGSLPISILEHSGSITEETREEPSGPITSITISGTIIKTSKTKEALLRAYLNKRLLVLIEDNNGQVMLIGTTEEQARLSYNPSFDEGLAGLQGIRFTVTYKGTTPKLYYTGTIPA